MVLGTADNPPRFRLACSSPGLRSGITVVIGPHGLDAMASKPLGLSKCFLFSSYGLDGLQRVQGRNIGGNVGGLPNGVAHPDPFPYLIGAPHVYTLRHPRVRIGIHLHPRKCVLRALEWCDPLRRHQWVGMTCAGPTWWCWQAGLGPGRIPGCSLSRVCGMVGCCSGRGLTRPCLEIFKNQGA